MYKGWIFDLDGVITDTAEYHYQAWKALADREGIPFSHKQNEALRGVSRADSLRLLLQGREVDQSKFLEMMEWKNNHYVSLLEKMSPANVFPGVRELLLELGKNGVRIALGSSSKNALRVLELLDLSSAFDAVVDGNSVASAKPAPDVFLKAAELLKLNPRDCVVVEDAESGVEAALCGGFCVVGIGPVERVGKAHIQYPQPEEISILEVNQLKKI